MKLIPYQATLDEKLHEFDLWVTPSLGEIRDSPQFKAHLSDLQIGFNLLSSVTKEFQDYQLLAPHSLSIEILEHLSEEDTNEAEDSLLSICKVLLLATGKTDNNLKCQFPLFLRNKRRLLYYPVKALQGVWREKELPRTITMDNAVKIIVSLYEKPEYQAIFMESYLSLIVSDEQYAKQVWCLGNAYVTQKAHGLADALISSIAIFQSRGSITASQGHIPEHILRTYMLDWGLDAGSDFNLQDVEISEFFEDVNSFHFQKRRKYDFIIPYHTKKDGTRIFIQSQFYAGDSGSVSHKVVDQTDSTREATLRHFPKAVFIEYLDGAGYFSSLNGDLKRMLAKPTTKDFIQIRTAPVKLRRELQDIRFLTLLEIEHAIMCTDGSKESVCSYLLKDGYSQEEISRVLQLSIDRNRLSQSPNGILMIRLERVEIARRYCILDLIAIYGKPLSNFDKGGFLTVAGYQACWGLRQADLVKKALETAPGLDLLWETKLTPFQDIQWLLENGYVEAK